MSPKKAPPRQPANTKRPATVAQKPRKPTRANDLVIIPVNNEHNSRTLIYLTIGATLVSGLYADFLDEFFLIPIGFCLVYPLIIHTLTKAIRRRFPTQVSYTLILLDAFFIGATIVGMGAPTIPTILLLIMANAGFIIVGSIAAYFACLVFLALGGYAVYYGLGIDIISESPAFMNYVCALGVGVHVAVSAYYNHAQAKSLHVIRQEIHSQKEQYRSLSRKLSKYLSPQVWQTIFAGKEVRLETHRKKLTVFFSDIKGFTNLSETIEPESLTEVLNTYLNDMSKIALKYGGTIDKFIGDAVMIFYGDPQSKGVKNDALACVSMAIEMRKHMHVLRQRWRKQGIETPLEIRMGINTGYCTVGNFGAETRMDYTIIGKEVNLASRLESNSEAGEILISYETFALVKDRILCREKGQINVKGFTRPVPIYQVVDFRRESGGQLTFNEMDLDGFSMHFDTEKVNNFERDKILKMLEDAKSAISKQVR